MGSRGQPAWPTLTTPSLQPWLASIAANLVLSIILVPGEEIGWRGYLLTRLIDAGVPNAVVVSGIIWGLWHVPLVLWGGYIQATPSPLLSAGILMITTTSLGYVLARLRLDTGSIWPPIVLHAAMNTVIQAVFDPATSGADHALWVGEAGIVTSITLILVALCAHARRPGTAFRSASQKLAEQFPLRGPEGVSRPTSLRRAESHLDSH